MRAVESSCAVGVLELAQAGRPAYAGRVFKSDLVAELAPLVARLRSSGMSWRQVAEALGSAGLSVSESYLKVHAGPACKL